METDQQMLVEEKEKEETNKKQTENKVKLLSPFQQKHMRNATGFIGVRKARGGKFGAEIKDPTTKKYIWLGTFNTAEEASNAFLLKKQEFLATHQFVKMPLMLAMETNQQLLVEEKEKDETNKKQTENKVKFTPFQHNYRGNVTGLIGVNKRKNGKFGAAIRDPITKKTVWLGTFNTAEEASNAYLLKKQEFLATLQSVNKPSKGLLGTQRLQSGRYGARITDPFSHKEVWLGTFDTVEDASQAYLSKKSEFEKLVKANQGKEPIICVESSKEALCLMANVHGTKSSNGCIVNIATSHPKAKRSLLGIRTQKNGWNVDVVKDLIRSKKVLLGTSDTVVADSETYFSKKSEFEKLSKGSKENKPKNCDHINDQTIYVGRNKTNSQKTTSILGVRKRESGRYNSEICDRISNKLIWLGMFDTAEEASQAFQSKKLEIQKLVKAKQQCNLKTHSSARAKQDGKEKLVDAKQGHETVHEGFQLESGCGASSLETDVPMSNSFNGGRIESHEISHSMGVQKRKLGKHTSEILLETLGTVEEAFNAYQCKKSGFQISKKAEFQTDKPTDSSAGENQLGKEDEDLWKGQWVQLPDNKEVNISLKLGVPIIDNYGYLLGEFRSLDDLRIVKH